MLTAPSATAAPTAVARDLRATVRRSLPAAAVIAGVALVLGLVYQPWYLNYDARYALLWAHDAWHGFMPEYGADFAPTPHPFSTAISSLGLPFGDAGGLLIVALVLLGFGALVWLVYRLGEELFDTPWVGVVAALVVLTRPALDRDALLAYQDVWFEALVVGAVLLEARRPRRGLAVLVVLAVAGLIRPDAWALSVLYVIWLWRGRTNRERAGYVALALSAPVIWALSDLIITGDLLHSLHGTAALADEVDRRRGIAQVPRWTAQYFAYTLREPAILAVPVGLAFAWYHRRRAALLPLAAAVATTAVFAAGPIFGLPLIGRYIRTPSVLLALFYGLAVCGWLLLPRGSTSRRRWMAAGGVVLAVSLAYIPWQARMLSGLQTRVDRDGQYYSDIRELARAPEMRAAFAACAPITTTDHRPIPFLRWWLHGAPGTVGTTESHASPRGGVVVIPRRSKVARRFYGRKVFRHVHKPPPRGYDRIYRNRSFAAYAKPGCSPSG